jgi:hypothetical protein
MTPENKNSGYITFSFRPTLMIRKYETLKYNVGLNIGFSAVNRDPFQVDYAYFNRANTETVRPIHEANEAASLIFVGIIFGIKF